MKELNPVEHEKTVRKMDQLTKNEIMFCVPRTVSSCFNEIQMTFVVVSPLWAKRGWSTTRTRPKNSLHKGFPSGETTPNKGKIILSTRKVMETVRHMKNS